MMRVLVLSHGLVYGGAQIALLNYLALLKDIVQLDVLTCNDANSAFRRDIHSLGIKVFATDCKLVNNLPLMHVEKHDHLIKSADIVWISDIEYLTATELKSITNRPVIAHLHSYALVCPWWALSYGMREVCTINCRGCFGRFLTCKVRRNAIRAKVEMYNYGFQHVLGTVIKSPADFYNYKRFYEKAIQAVNFIDGFIAVSKCVKDLHVLHESLFENKLVEVIYNPVVLPKEYVDYSLSVNVNAKTVLYASGFQAAKGIHVLLNAFREVVEDEKDVKLLITRGLGDPGLMNLISRLGISKDNVVLLKHLSRHELFKTYADSTVVVMPSVWPEPLPNVALESNLLGVPVVASKICGLKEVVIDGETGYLVRLGDAHELAKSLTKALSNDWNRKEIHSVASKRFDPAKSAERLLKFFEEFL
jgi:glycosyltransferase involved in cell wall biosynthesis